jgi:hypothetical protein
MASGRSSRSSNEIDLRVTAADVAALRRVRQRKVSPEEYARMLAQLRVPPETLRRRSPMRGERFRL